jgi:hypothetical protein
VPPDREYQPTAHNGTICVLLDHTDDHSPCAPIRQGGAAADFLCGPTVMLGHLAIHGRQVLEGAPTGSRSACGSPTESPQVRGRDGFPTGIPQTERDYAVHDGTAGRMDNKLLTSANAGKNGQRCFA